MSVLMFSVVLYIFVIIDGNLKIANRRGYELWLCGFFLLIEIQNHLEDNNQKAGSLKTKCIFFLRVLCDF